MRPKEFVSRELSERFAQIGMRRRATQVFVHSLAEGVEGHVGFMIASKYFAPGAVGVAPVIGVRNAVVEDTLARFASGQVDPRIATVSRGLGYLMPGGVFTEWTIDTHDEAAVRRAVSEVIQAYVAYGRPFQERLVPLAALATCLSAEALASFSAAYRAPVALAALGESDGALRELDLRLTSLLGADEGTAGDAYRSFAARLRDEIVSGGRAS